MRTKVYSKNKRRIRVIKPVKAVITSAYKLESSEIDALKKQFSIIGEYEVENIINPEIYAGVIINVGTKRIDLSLESGLQNLKQFIYENS